MCRMWKSHDPCLEPHDGGTSAVGARSRRDHRSRESAQSEREHTAGTGLEVRDPRRFPIEKREPAVVGTEVGEQRNRRQTPQHATPEPCIVRDRAAFAIFDERLLEQEPVVEERIDAVGDSPSAG